MSRLTEITVVGRDKTGLIARVTTLLFERNVNIKDLDQAVRDGLFRMTMHEGDYRLGMDPAIDAINPDRPIDGIGRASSDGAD